MLRRTRLLLAAFSLVLSVAACGDDDDAAAGPSATLGTSTTGADATTTTSELTVEQEVEAAYLRSWEIYTEAVRTFDTSQLNEVYSGDALRSRIDEVNRLRQANTPARIDVVHDVTIEVADDATAVVRDDYFNHSVLLDGETGEPIEADPNEVVKREYLMRVVDGKWKVAFVTAR